MEEADTEFFNSEYIGIDDIHGEKILCGDRVLMHEKVVEKDYTRPILDFDNGTFTLLERESIRKVKGVIRYDVDYCAFVFFPDSEGQMCYIPYVRKPVKNYDFIAIEKVPQNNLDK